MWDSNDMTGDDGLPSESDFDAGNGALIPLNDLDDVLKDMLRDEAYHVGLCGELLVSAEAVEWAVAQLEADRRAEEMNDLSGPSEAS